MQRLTGIGASRGVAVGQAVVLVLDARLVRYSVTAEHAANEVGRLEQARTRSRAQLESIRSHLASTAGAELASLFDAQLLMLDDPMLVTRAAALVTERRINAEWALQQAFDPVSSVLDHLADPYLRERRGDVADVLGRLRMNLRREAEGPASLFRDIDAPSVLVADELPPSMVAQLDWSRIRAFATDTGSRTSHTAILARSLDVPAVVGLHDASRRIAPGSTVIVDADSGALIVDPSAEVLHTASRYPPGERRTLSRGPSVHGPTVTRDGVRVRLEANVERLQDLEAVKQLGAEGIGLFRSEFLLAFPPLGAPSEDAQAEAYHQLVEGMAPHPVTVRTFDIDEEQLGGPASFDAVRPAGVEEGAERWMGLRGVRLGLRQRELLKTQLRALIRAGQQGGLRVMLPFVSSLEDLREARALVEEARADLAARGQPARAVPIGVMIEVPSAAFTADLLARDADFFTIGTNDLIQYCLAVDRTDDRVSHLYNPLNPAVIRLIRRVRRAASRRGIPVALCGEMASDPALLPLLVGLGLTEFSMMPAAMPAARQLLSDLNAAEWRRIAHGTLKLETAREIERYLATSGRGADHDERVAAGEREGGDA
jgi:phosphotransferase system enzyme I (PtsI)